MAKKGMFGWLGFGRNKEKKEVSEQSTEVEVLKEEIVEADQSTPETTNELITDNEIVIESADTEAPVIVAESEPVVIDESIVVQDDDSNVPDTEIEQLEQAIVIDPTPVVEESEIADEPVIEDQPVADDEPAVNDEPAVDIEPVVVVEKKSGFFTRLKEGLKRTKENFGSGFFSLFKGKKIDDELFEELEERLLIADVGVDTTLKVIRSLTESASRKQLKDGEALYQLLQDELSAIIEPVSKPLVIEPSTSPYVILMVGVNGVGKTTTIGKLAKKFQQQGKKVALAAGDTFRAAAVEQLQVWGDRNDITVIAQHTGADSASVIFDAVQAAKARNVDVLIADTAGRLQNKAHLMNELEKIVRVMKKLDPSAPHEIMLTLDAGTGQNAISQVELFHKSVGITGLTLTKLDGTAKGGVIFGLADKFGIPIRYIGVGEGIDDLREFNSKEFIEALFVKD